jgi:hypothetical protein
MLYTEQEMHDLIAKVEAEFSASLVKAEEELKKAEDEEEKEEAEEKQEDKKDKKKEDSEEDSEEKEDSENEDMEKNEECSYNDEDVEEMHKMYKSMNKSEQKLHYDAIKKAMVSEGLAKSEVAEVKKDESLKLAKSELEILKTSNEELKKSNEELQKGLSQLVEMFKTKVIKPATAPKQKAITELSAIKKTEEKEEVKILSRPQIISILKEKAKDASLKKSDRTAINDYCVNKNGSLDKIQHLLK